MAGPALRVPKFAHSTKVVDVYIITYVSDSFEEQNRASHFVMSEYLPLSNLNFCN